MRESFHPGPCKISAFCGEPLSLFSLPEMRCGTMGTPQQAEISLSLRRKTAFPDGIRSRLTPGAAAGEKAGTRPLAAEMARLLCSGDDAPHCRGSALGNRLLHP